MREMIEDIRSRQPVTLLLVAVNIIVFMVLSYLGDTENGLFMAMHGASFTPFIVEEGEYYRLVTCMFLHFGIEHLFNNMLVLFFLGDTLEKMLGKVRFLSLYLLSGIAGNVLSVWIDLQRNDFAVSAGASGAIFGVIGALACAVIINKGKIPEYSGRRLLIMAALSVLQGVTATGVDAYAHLGGFAAGFLIALLFGRRLRSYGKKAEEIPVYDYRDIF